MTMIPPTSSTTANVRMKIRAPSGRRFPAKVTTPTANAMSVATGMPQPFAPGAAVVDEREDEGGHQHPAQRGERRQGGGTRVAELAEEELALDLEPGEEEEQRHRGVVHPAPQREVEVHRAAERHTEGGVPELLVAVAPSRVGPDEGGDRGHQHDGAGGGFELHEAQRPAARTRVARSVRSPATRCAGRERRRRPPGFRKALWTRPRSTAAVPVHGRFTTGWVGPERVEKSVMRTCMRRNERTTNAKPARPRWERTGAPGTQHRLPRDPVRACARRGGTMHHPLVARIPATFRSADDGRRAHARGGQAMRRPLKLALAGTAAGVGLLLLTTGVAGAQTSPDINSVNQAVESTRGFAEPPVGHHRRGAGHLHAGRLRAGRDRLLPGQARRPRGQHELRHLRARLRRASSSAASPSPSAASASPRSASPSRCRRRPRAA